MSASGRLPQEPAGGSGTSGSLEQAVAREWTDQELHAAATRATEKMYPQGRGTWNRVAWLRAVLVDLRAVRALSPQETQK